MDLCSYYDEAGQCVLIVTLEVIVATICFVSLIVFVFVLLLDDVHH